MDINSFKSRPTFLISILPNYLKDANFEYHSYYCPSCIRLFIAVVRNLHYSTHTTDIIDTLAELRYSVQYITMKSQITEVLFFVSFHTTISNNDRFSIFDIFNLFHTVISTGKPLKINRGPPECL